MWDALLAAGFVIAGEIELLRFHPGVVGVIGVGLAYAMLAFRRRRPLPAGATMYATWFTLSLVAVDIQPLNIPLIAALITSYSMGRYTEGGRCRPSLVRRPAACSRSSSRWRGRPAPTSSSRPRSR